MLPEAPAENDDANDSLFSLNPFCGDRARKIGIMADDLYVKSSLILRDRFSKHLDQGSSESNNKEN
jgi:hypothetical protein